MSAHIEENIGSGKTSLKFSSLSMDSWSSSKSSLSKREEEENGFAGQQSGLERALRNRWNNALQATTLAVSLLFISVVGFYVSTGAVQDVFSLLFRSHVGSSSSLNTKTSSSSSSSSSNDLTITAVGEYDDSSMASYPFLEGAFLAEAWHDTLFSVQDVSAGCEYQYTFYGPTDAANGVDASSYKPDPNSDGQITWTPEATGKYTMTTTETCKKDSGDSSASSTRTSRNTVWVKYIRREVTTLSDRDRDDFLDAFATMWEVSTTRGKELYGDAYKSLHYFAQIHNDAGANAICDEFHGGLGFVNNHLYLGSFLEQSLQLVNPRTALHYIEYTKYFSDSSFAEHEKNSLDGGTWTELMTSKYFGSNDPVSGKIIDGRWADFVLPTLTDDFFIDHAIDPDSTFFPDEEKLWLLRTGPHMNSPYGLLRSPWNYNPSNYTIRYNNVNQINASLVDEGAMAYYSGVTCTDLDIFIEDHVVDQPLVEYLTSAEDDSHGKIHFSFGGAGGDYAYSVNQYLMKHHGFSDQMLIVAAQAAQTFFKFYLAIPPETFEYLNGFPFPLNCSAVPWQDGELTTTAWPNEEGGPTCEINPYYTKNEDNLEILMAMYFADFWNALGSSTPQTNTMQTILDMDFSERKKVMKLLCSRMSFDGDMAGSGAATDPLFWVAHGSVERLMQHIMLNDGPSDKIYNNTKLDCSGHNNDGTKAWLSGFTFSDLSVAPEEVTNTDLITFLDPTGSDMHMKLNYVYDSNDYSFCSNSNVWFDSSRRKSRR